MAKTISANSGSVYLTAASESPLTILTGITVSGSNYGVHGTNSQAWVVTNKGTVIGTSVDGVYLGAGGTLTNSGTAARISGGADGLHVIGTATATNYGSISGALGYGVFISGGGIVTNSGTAASIYGKTDGVDAPGGAATVANQGTISGYSQGVYLGAGGTVTNSGTAAHINGHSSSGVGAGMAAATVINQGTISSTQNYGVSLTMGGVVTNSTGAVITGGYGGVDSGFLYTGGAITVINQGSIYGSDVSGVLLGVGGGTVTNSSAAARIAGGKYGVWAKYGVATVVNEGSISGTSGAGVYLEAGGTLVNGGRITGGIDAARFAAGYADRLVVDPGAAFSGAVDGGNTIGAAYVSTLELVSSGTLSGIGTQFVNFGSIAFDTGAAWLVEGNTAGLAAGQTIGGFTLGDTIELTGFVETSSTFTGSGLVLAGAGGPKTIGIQGSFTTSSFHVTNDGANSFVELACFAAGTRIRTERGMVAVEALRVGDRVPVVRGCKSEPIIWLGHRRIDCRRHPKPTHVWPVCISAGAFGPGRPFRDLWLSPDHAVFVNDVLIPIRYLVNGCTIRQESRDEITYWHVELADHNVLHAEGVPAESYLDTGNRSAFANGGAVMDLHADFAWRVWETRSCAPLVLCGPKLTAAKRRLHNRVHALGHRTSDDPALKILANGREVFAKRKLRTLHIRLHEATEHIRLTSRVWVPAHMRPDTEDARALGIAISRVWVDGEERGLGDACFTLGWHAPEQDWRWTDGDACVATTGARELAFEVMMAGLYWRDRENDKVRVA